MKTSLIKKLLIGILPVALIITLTIQALNASDNGKAGANAAYGEANCTDCHGSYILNLANGYVRLGNPTDNLLTTLKYRPGNLYTLTTTVSYLGKPLFGFAVIATFANGSNAGTLAAVGTDTQIKIANGRNNIVHTLNGGLTTNSHTFTFRWTAPPSGSGTVYFNVSGVAANNNGSSSSDYVYTKKYIVTQL